MSGQPRHYVAARAVDRKRRWNNQWHGMATVSGRVRNPHKVLFAAVCKHYGFTMHDVVAGFIHIVLQQHGLTSIANIAPLHKEKINHMIRLIEAPDKEHFATVAEKLLNEQRQRFINAMRSMR